MEVYREGDTEVARIGPLGPYGNNAYIVADRAANASLIVDMPAEGEKLLEALSGANVQAIVATHWHPDHWMSYDLVRGATKAPVYVHAEEVRIPPERIDARVTDGEEIRVGSARLRVIHTPGHTPGSICLYEATHGAIFTGDTLLRMSIGRTDGAGGNKQAMLKTLERLPQLPADTRG